ncbi:hypothetical protein [Novosphingobium aquimarinum]|uniref:hypothetical protein n=1 Tax=Novosphingobium aquimarinum TaxID=2682494 RepID=UPI0012ECB6A9|nr:hypothetical protein [Novosphingobium aquimarinum]
MLDATEQDGSVRVFVELNGQMRIVTTTNRHVAAAIDTRRMADLSAPMPGGVSTTAAETGQKSRRDNLDHRRSHKMKASELAQRTGTIIELTVRVGQSVKAKDILAIVG